jgi:hypothetical protein
MKRVRERTWVKKHIDTLTVARRYVAVTFKSKSKNIHIFHMAHKINIPVYSPNMRISVTTESGNSFLTVNSESSAASHTRRCRKATGAG